VSMLLLSLMMESCSSVPGVNPLPTLIAQSVLCHAEDVAEAFFGRLRDISVDVRTAAANFLISAMKCAPMLFVSLIHNGMKTKGNGITLLKNNNNAAASNNSTSSLFSISSDSIGNIFPSITNMLIHDPGTIENCRANVEIGKCKLSYYETRSKESAPGLHLILLSQHHQQQSSSYDENFLKLSAFFVKNVRTALSYDLQQFTTHDSTHCAVLSGVLLEIMCLPTFYPPQTSSTATSTLTNTTLTSSTSSSSSSPQHFVAFVLNESIPSIAQHVTARLSRMEDRTRNVIEEIVQSATKKLEDPEDIAELFGPQVMKQQQQQQDSNNSSGDTNSLLLIGASASAEFALKSVSKRVPDEFKSFARGAVHLTQLRLELWSLLKAKEELQRLREIDPDE
jgi:hypothetical protein